MRKGGYVGDGEDAVSRYSKVKLPKAHGSLVQRKKYNIYIYEDGKIPQSSIHPPPPHLLRPRNAPKRAKRIVVGIRVAPILHIQSSIPRHILAIHTRNPGQHGVDTRRHPAGRPDVSVFDPARARHPSGVGTHGGGGDPLCFVSGCAAAVEDAGAGEDRGAGADGEDVAEIWINRPDKVDLLGHITSRAQTTRHEQDLDAVGARISGQVVGESGSRDDALAKAANGSLGSLSCCCDGV